MTLVDRTNPLTGMLANAFTKLDRDKNGSLDSEEFKAFYEVLKPGIAQDENGKLNISEHEYAARMDSNGDGGVTLSEMQGTGVLIPAKLTGESLQSMLKYLLEQTSASALSAATLLARVEAPEAAEATETAEAAKA